MMLSLKKMAFNDPAYVGNVQLQRGIKDNLKTISDSLSALSKRIPQIQSAVGEEMQQINFNLDKVWKTWRNAELMRRSKSAVHHDFN
ncbi:hypothetical protein CS542_00090 [Pedobacter sp. IW39]|nr:hypothetical protein CS542_00090 [Pedobacter sp. IW39]